jgi:transcriptional regulator with XRE-family HTH domain
MDTPEKDAPYAGGELAALIQAAVDRGVSEREMERRAESAGVPVSHSQFNKYRRGLARRYPSEEKLQGIAAGLQAPFAVVKRAVVKDWAGYDLQDVTGEGLGDQTWESFPEDVKLVLRMLGQWMANRTPEKRAALSQELLMRVAQGS